MKPTKAQADLLRSLPLKIEQFRFFGHTGTKRACDQRGWLETVYDDDGNAKKVVITKAGREALKSH